MQNNLGGGPDFKNGGGGGKTMSAQRTSRARSPLSMAWVQGPLKGHGALGFRCSLVLSEPCFEAF